MNTKEEQVWSGIERRLAAVEAFVPNAPAWRTPSQTDLLPAGAVRLGRTFGQDRDGRGRSRRTGLIWVLIVLGALLAMVIGAIVAGALRLDSRPDLSHGPLGPAGLLRGSDSTGNTTLLADGRVLIMTGRWVGPEGTAVSIPQVWDPKTTELRQIAPPIDPRVKATSTLLLDGRVLIVGGFGGPYAYPSSAVATAELWDPETESFRATGSMAGARVGHSATLLEDGRVLVIGGAGPGTDDATAELWDPVTGQFTAAGLMRFGRRGHAAALTGDGRVFVLGGAGSDGTGRGLYELWDPATSRFDGEGTLLDQPSDVSVTRLLDGRVLFIAAAGASMGRPIVISHIYPRPIVPVGPDSYRLVEMQHALFGQSAVLLADGRVLVFGGATSPTDATTAVEIWDPATDSFTSATSHPGPIADHTLTLLPDGRILVVGPPAPGENASTVVVYTLEAGQ